MVASPSDPATRNGPGTPRWVKLFGIAVIVVVLLIVVVMLVAGGEHGPGRHTGSGDATRSAATSHPATADGVGGPAHEEEAARAVEVTALDTMAFQPSSIELSAGEVVTFRVTNKGQAAHEFTLGDAAMQREHADAMAHMPDGMAHELPNSLTVEAGETKQLTWRFGHAGSLEFACHEPGHYEAGMRGQITVG